jgi:uncharacterized protein (DUF58 family)
MILIAAAAAPAALAIGLAAPAYWSAGLGLIVLLIALALVDALAGVRPRHAELDCEAPVRVSVGETFPVTAVARFPRRAPARAELAIGVAGPVAALMGLRAKADEGLGESVAAFALRTERRGTARILGLWVRWAGPLGLVWKQRHLALDHDVLITPDIRAVRDMGIQMLNPDANYGVKAQLQVGEGAEFEALASYRQGMDRRAIDWKQSARHSALIAKEYRTERNNNIVLAVDAGRAMSEPLAAPARAAAAPVAEGREPPAPDAVPRVDRAVSAALLTAYVALKDGDRVGLFSFDSHPRAASPPISGERAFATLQRVAAAIDYSTSETNYTLGIATLAAGLSRRALIVVFTEFADTISAELMLGAVGALLKRHLVLFVVLKDEELEALAAAEPNTPEDVSRAVTAAGLLRERRLVLTRLRHLGVHVLEAAAADTGPSLVAAYLDFKRRGLL